MKPVFIPVRDAIDALLAPAMPAFLDVRSEGEFEAGSIPGFLSAPILNNEERKAVGICYKERGQAAAIELGVKLTAAAKPGRVKEWLERAGEKNRIVVACWRGGLRSQFACEWLGESAKVPVTGVKGGYKAIRGELLQHFDRLPELIVITGSTGAMKTELLKAREDRSIDLENFAHHRGSSFGEMDIPQPSQTTFENRILLRLEQLERGQAGECIVEDESVMIGKCTVPRPFKLKMNASPTIEVEATVEERVAHLVEEYALDPQHAGHSPERTLDTLRRQLLRLQKSLGGLQTSTLLQKLESAFAEAPLDPERHAEWVKPLLVDYYDRHYGHYREKHGRKVIFRGNFKECTEWIRKRYG